MLEPGQLALYRTKDGRREIPVVVTRVRVASTGKLCYCVRWSSGDFSWVLAAWCREDDRGDGGGAPHAEPGARAVRPSAYAMELRARLRSSSSKQGG